MKHIIFVFLISIAYTGFAQQDSTLKWLQFGTAMNAYKGDFQGKAKYTSSFHIGLQFNKKRKLNGSVMLAAGTLNGEDRNFSFESSQTPKPTPNQFVKTDFFHLSYELHYNIIKTENLIVYLSQGIGLIRYTPKDSEGNTLEDQPETRAEGESYRKESLMLPTSVGAVYLLPNQFGIAVQGGYLNTLTDYLDNISTLGDSSDNDNVLQIRLGIYVPLR